MRLTKEVAGKLVALACMLVFTGVASADIIHFGADVDFGGHSPVYQPSEGGSIGYEVWVSIDPTHDAHGEGSAPSSQGIYLFNLNIESNFTEVFPDPLFSKVKTSGPGRIIHENWTNATTQKGAFGYTLLSDTGNTTSIPGNILGTGAAMPLVWDADVDDGYTPELNPHALHNVGYGSPPGTDVGGNPTPPANARAKWYLYKGSIPVPHDPGDYTVQIVPQAGINIIIDTIDLNFDSSAYNMNAVQNGDITEGEKFLQFTVKPEPATLSLLLLGGAGLLLRRRR